MAADPIQDWTHSMSRGFGTPTVDTESTPPTGPRSLHPSPAVLSEARPRPLQLRPSSDSLGDGSAQCIPVPRPAASRWPA